MQEVNSPFVQKLKALETHIQTAQNVTKDKQAALDSVTEEAKHLYEEAQGSILQKFMYKKGIGQDQASVANTMRTIFNSKDASNQVTALMDAADKVSEGKVIKDALRGSYMQHVLEKIKGGQELGIAGVEEGGHISTATRANVKNITKMEKEGSTDQAIMDTLYKDTPELSNNIAELNKAYVNMTKKTPAATNNVLQEVPKGENPEQGMGSLITYTMGTLNRRAAKARRITGPLSIDNLQKVKDARNAVLMTFLADPKGAATIVDKVRNGIMTEEIKRQWSAALARGAARAWMTGDGKDPTVEDDMNSLQ
jgi:hypothetical protein